MRTLTTTEASNNIGKLWEELADGPVTILSAGRPVAVVIAPDDYAVLTRAAGAGRPAVTPGFGRALLPDLDVDALLATPLDRDFEGYL